MTATLSPNQWRVGTVTQVIHESIGIRSYAFEFDTPVSHLAGQHYELRLTAEDGYQAARLYSAAMPANGTSNMLQLTIALMDYGEVSPYLFKFVKTDSQIEIRGPFGKHFVRESNKSTPLLLIGAGTGVVPLRAMRLEHQYENSKAPIHLLYSVKSHFDMAYKYELLPREGDTPMDVEITFTRQSPNNWTGNIGRINSELINKTLETYADTPMAYICGPTPFVESVANLLIEAGQPAEMIKTERFGATAN